MYSTARVIEKIDSRTVLVGCSTEACQACKAAMFCNNKNDTSFLVRNDKGLSFEKGDEVELYMPPAKTVASTALVFVLPLVLFPLGYSGVKFFFSFNELINALGGFATMALGFVIASVVSVRRKRELMPVITQIVPEREQRN